MGTASEFIENNGEDDERQKTMGEEERKQDCETIAFKRSAEKNKECIPGITEEYEKISEKEVSRHAEFVNDINYNGKPVNMWHFWEEKIIKGESVRTDFQWLISIRISKKNAEKVARGYHPCL